MIQSQVRTANKQGASAVCVRARPRERASSAHCIVIVPVRAPCQCFYTCMRACMCAYESCAVTGTHVTPVIGIVTEDMTNLSHLTPSEDEVADVFSLSLDLLVSDQSASVEFIPAHAGSSHPRQGGIYAPVFEGGPERVWGLTAFMTYGILRDVLLPAASECGMKLPPFALAADERLHRLVPLPRFEQAGGARGDAGGSARMSVPATISNPTSDKEGVASVVAATSPAQPS